MKLKATKKEIQNYYKNNILAISYGNAQHLLHYKKAFAYTAGTYGWNSDVYEHHAYAIVTGYHTFGKKVPHDIVKKYDTLAKEIIEDTSLWQDAKERKVHYLVNDLLFEVSRQ